MGTELLRLWWRQCRRASLFCMDIFATIRETTMAFDTLLQAPGMQILMKKLIEAASPQLVETIEGFTGAVRDLNMRLTAIEKSQAQILAIIGANDGERATGN